MKNIKKFVTASLTALALCPTIATLAYAAPASAAGSFISDTDYNNAINIDESQISINYTTSRAFGSYLATKVSNGVISTKQQASGFPTLQKVQIIINVQGTKIDQNAVNELKTTQLKLHCNVEGIDNTQTYNVSSVEKKSKTSYDLVFDNVILLGNALSFDLSKITKVTGLKCGSALVQSNGGNSYYYINVKTPNGENLYIKLRNVSNVSLNNMKNWAKRICMYANSLSQMTGAKLGTLYMNFDDYGSYAYSCNAKINADCNKLGLVGFSENATTYELERMALGNNEITWCVLHEVAHSYGVYVTPSTFSDNYNFGDDYLTNARGITAIQNCDNLRNTKIYSGNRGGKSYTYDLIAEKIEIDKQIDGTSDYVYYTFAKKLCAIAKRYGWQKLEDYFAAVNNDNAYNSTENKKAAADLNSLLGTNISTSKTDFLKFTNNLRKLYKICWSQTTYETNNFKAFVTNEFDTNYIKEVIAFNKY